MKNNDNCVVSVVIRCVCGCVCVCVCIYVYECLLFVCLLHVCVCVDVIYLATGSDFFCQSKIQKTYTSQKKYFTLNHGVEKCKNKPGLGLTFPGITRRAV